VDVKPEPDQTEEPCMSRYSAADDLGALRQSTGDGSLQLLYQPEVDLPTGTIVAMEALLRWRHPSRGLLEPSDFLELAESSGEMSRIGTWVLYEGISEALVWSKLPGPTRRLWLNVSRAELMAPGFVELVATLIDESGLRDGSLGIEVSESCIVDLGHGAAPLLGRLRDAGVAIAVDDFSSWYATLGAIQALPIDVVKLCQKYVRNISNEDGGRIVSTIVTQAHRHGLSVVAEGVETWAEAVRLTELGCDRAHGWLYASAQRADKARWLLEHGTGWQTASIPLPPPSMPVPMPMEPLLPIKKIGFAASSPSTPKVAPLLAPFGEG
jgi:EAL domain-containing protein (putative c-di-GMP-specific phosphodiesterase class I)